MYGSADSGKKDPDDNAAGNGPTAGNGAAPGPVRGPPLETISVLVDRAAMDVATVTQRYLQDQKPPKEPLEGSKGRIWAQKAKKCIQDTIPIVDWLGNYKWRKDLIGKCRIILKQISPLLQERYSTV